MESNRLAKVRELASNRLTVDYLTRTADGRILFGSRGAPYAFGSRISANRMYMSRHSTACTAQLSNGFPLCEEFTSLTTGASTLVARQIYAKGISTD